MVTSHVFATVDQMHETMVPVGVVVHTVVVVTGTVVGGT